MSIKNSINYVNLTSIDSSTIDATFRPINPLGLDEGCFLIRITNASDAAANVSFDGVSDDHSLQPNAIIEVFCPGSCDEYTGVRKGSIIMVRGGAGTGMIYLSGYYI